MSTTSRYDNIDGLRALAALLVISFHYGTNGNAEFLRYSEDLVGWAYGAAPVYLFFVISGYCIAMTAQRAATPYEFLIRRVSRLLPTFFACVVLTSVAVTVLGHGNLSNTVVNTLLNALWAPMLIPGMRLVDGVYWSLFIEMKFYLIFWLLLVLARNNVRRAAAYFAALTVVGMALYTTGLGNEVFVPIYRFQGIAQGLLLFPASAFFLLGLVVYLASGRWVVIGLAALGAMIASYFCAPTTFFRFGPPTMDVWIVTAAIICIAALILPNTAIQLPKSLTYIGAVSYPLYLLHENIGFALISDLQPVLGNDYLRVLVVTALMIGLAGLVSFLVEHRFRKPLEAAFRWPVSLVSRRVQAAKKPLGEGLEEAVQSRQ